MKDRFIEQRFQTPVPVASFQGRAIGVKSILSPSGQLYDSNKVVQRKRKAYLE